MDTTLTNQGTSSAGSSETINDSDIRDGFREGFNQPGSTVKQKEAELKEMQDQIESYNQMVKQLTSQREMAVKKLAEMDHQIAELTARLETERVQVEAKDKELRSKRSQLETLKNEENELQEKFNGQKKELDLTAENLSKIQLHESQVKAKLTELQHFENMTNSAIDEIEKAITVKDTIKLGTLCNQMLTPPNLSVNSLLTNGVKLTSSTSPLANERSSTEPPSALNENDPFDSSANYDPFADNDPFDGEDPFKSEGGAPVLPEDDPFNPSSATVTGTSLSQLDPFGAPAARHGF